jgi:glutamate racemase
MNPRNRPIGVFDSGVGGLSVLKAIHALLPAEALFYFADQAHVPYGSRTLKEVSGFAFSITKFLLKQGVKMVVVACNTASAAALHPLREKFPTIPFVGMEPAVKPAAESTQTGSIGVLATPATFQGMLYASVVERYGTGVKVIQKTCPGLVELIEEGDLSSRKVHQILENALLPMVDEGIDAVVLGCTHYPFVIPAIQEIVGKKIQVIDPAPAIARQVYRLLTKEALITEKIDATPVQFYTSGKKEEFNRILPILFGTAGKVGDIIWENQSIVINSTD